MACVVKFTLGSEKGQNVEFTFDDFENTGDTSIEYILSQIYKHIGDNQSKWDEIKTILLKQNYKVDGLTSLMKKSIEEKALLPINYNSSKFVEGTNINVLLVKDIKSLADKTYNFGMRLIQNGEEIFIVKNSPSGIRSFKNYLKLYKELDSQKYEANDEDNKILDIINKRRKRKFNNFNELVLNFITDKDYFQKNHSDVYTYLDDFCNTLLGNLQKTRFNNDILNALYRVSSTKDYGRILSLKWPQFINVIERLAMKVTDDSGNTIIELDPEIKDFQEYYSKTLSEIKDDEYNGVPLWKRLSLSQETFEQVKDKPVYATIISQLLRTDVNFDYRFAKGNKKEILLAKRSKNFGQKFNYSFQTIQKFIVDEFYKGYGIFEYQGKWYVSKSIINDSLTDVLEFTSKEKAQSYIDFAYVNGRVATDTVLFRKIYGLHVGSRHSKNGNLLIPERIQGNVQRVLQLPSTLTDFKLNTAEINFIDSNQTLTKFFKEFIFQNWDLKETTDSKLIERMRKVLDDPQKIVALFYLTQQSNDGVKSKAGILNALNQIEKLKYDFYKPLNTNAYIKINKLIDVTEGPTTISSFYNTRHAFDQFKYRIQQISDGRLQVQLVTISQLLNDPEIVQLIPNIRNKVKQIKGFVHDNKIYINVDAEGVSLSDMAHEYFHVILALFKSNPNYYNFLDKFRELIKTDERVKRIYAELKTEESPYKNLSEYDLIEETLARCFGQQINGENIFEEDFINQLYIDDIKFSDIINSSDLTLEELFEKMNISDNADTFSKLFPTKKEGYVLSRKITNFIQSKIGKEIIEQCDN